MKSLRNPWNIYGPSLAVTVILYLAAAVVGFTGQQIIFGTISFVAIAGVVGIMWDIVYPRWLAKKINPYTRAYLQDHNADAYFEGISHWEKYAITRKCKIYIMLNNIEILCEQNRFQECLDMLAAYGKKIRGIEQKRYIYSQRLLCFQKMNNLFHVEKAQKELEAFESKYGKGEAAPVTADQSKRAMFCWLGTTIVFFALFIIIVLLDSHSGLGAFFLFFGCGNLLFSLGWLVRWLVVRAKEMRTG